MGERVGAFLLFASNVVSMIPAGTILFTLYGYHREAAESPGFRTRRAYAVIAVSLVLIVVPLTVTTARTVLGHLWQSRASSVAEGWAGDHGYELLKVGYEGANLVVLIEGIRPSPPRDELLERLRGEVPAGTPVILNAVIGQRALVGRVPG